MKILPKFNLMKFMSTHDLPIYGQLFAYGISLAAIGFELNQIVDAIDKIKTWF